MKKLDFHLYQPYLIMLAVYGFLLICALFLDTPSNLYQGLIAINTSRSVLITDYMGVGGVGATLLNAVIVGCSSIFLLIKSKVAPNGATIMALFLTTGFSFFGKNIFNMIPITFGVWLYAKSQREPFLKYSLVALLSATISPIVSEISFLGIGNEYIALPAGILFGVFTGFIFPVVSAFCVRVHDGYTLYNMGFAGGLISSFFVALLNGFEIEVDRPMIWSTGNNLPLGIILYTISAFLIFCGLFKQDKKLVLKDLKSMTYHSGRLASDFYILFGNSVYTNMGILCAFGTTLVLLLGADLNGPTLSGILAIAGFGCFGKHVKNIIPPVIGALIGTLTNAWDVTWSSNILAILFSTGLAPIAGQFGPKWGLVAGFLHVNFVIHVGYLNSGLNLYNNGFAAGFVALLLVPVITIFRKERR